MSRECSAVRRSLGPVAATALHLYFSPGGRFVSSENKVDGTVPASVPHLAKDTDSVGGV